LSSIQVRTPITSKLLERIVPSASYLSANSPLEEIMF
jgi:hypothetical protein